MAQRRFTLWTILVFLNAIIGLFFSVPDAPPINVVGILCGVITFVFIYVEVDVRLARRGLDALRKRLVISAVLRALLQLGLFVDLYTGMAALGLVHAVVGDVPFLSVYLAVLVHGTLLSIVLLLLMGIVHLVQLAYRRITARVEDVSTPV